MRTPLVLHASLARLRSVLLIVLLAADVPVVRFHGLDTAGRVLLCEEGCLVGCDLHQVFAARTYHAAHFREARASCELFRLRHRRTLITICCEGVDALTVGVGRCGGAVSHHQVVAVLVTVFFLRSFKGALDVFDSSGTHSCFCHSRSAIGSQRSIPLR